ncbi:hypothetical protein SS1G_03667 [Sclerotinia sclerotiorum 1980 UF-70]|uniref:Uncharacterized protein n=1 Tax=Sclerotinia sclerotiorum (strain ATCC 18683 / 1980 / Ss-1) TaxID=665079 RepID=A7EEC7_SCLS1|nr:hypothetical protein SS1G_03667 [Sclerotinia sclerotiorum 1980 UF-70]EDO01193.1 hypothetical protein SS1G_03667 [Sclerotinia sclerotiorum 1980 UF-70]
MAILCLPWRHACGKRGISSQVRHDLPSLPLYPAEYFGFYLLSFHCFLFSLNFVYYYYLACFASCCLTRVLRRDISLSLLDTI